MDTQTGLMEHEDAGAMAARKKALRAARKAKRSPATGKQMTQTEAGELVGVSQTTWSDWENPNHPDRFPDAIEMRTIREAFNLSDPTDTYEVEYLAELEQRARWLAAQGQAMADQAREMLEYIARRRSARP